MGHRFRPLTRRKAAYTTGDVAELLCMGTNTVIKMMRLGLLPYYILPGPARPHRRIAHDRLAAWLRGQPGMEPALYRLETLPAGPAPPPERRPRADRPRPPVVAACVVCKGEYTKLRNRKTCSADCSDKLAGDLKRSRYRPAAIA